MKHGRQRFGRSSGFVALVCASALVVGASAAEAGDDKERAKELFLEGRKAIDAGDRATGCAKMRESLGLFAVANTLFNVAQCDEGEGKIAAALEHWERGLALVDAKDSRVSVAKERIDALSPRVPRLRIVVPPGSAASVVVLDGAELSPKALEGPLYVEPGKHVIVVRAEGRKDREHEITLAEKERTEFVATPSTEVVEDAKPLPTTLPSAAPPPPSWTGRHTAAVVAGGVGVLGLVAAGITGGRVTTLANDIEALDADCNEAGACDVAGRNEKVDEYKSMLVANTIAWGVGVAGIGAGVVLFLTAPSTKDAKAAGIRVMPLVSPSVAGMGLSGRF